MRQVDHIRSSALFEETALHRHNRSANNSVCVARMINNEQVSDATTVQEIYQVLAVPVCVAMKRPCILSRI